VQPWKSLKRKLSPARRRKIDRAVQRELLAIDLRALRQRLGKTQTQVAELARMTQAELSKCERRGDHLVSTLERIIAALDGTLEMVAVIDGKRIALRRTKTEKY